VRTALKLPGERFGVPTSAGCAGRRSATPARDRGVGQSDAQRVDRPGWRSAVGAGGDAAEWVRRSDWVVGCGVWRRSNPLNYQNPISVAVSSAAAGTSPAPGDAAYALSFHTNAEPYLHSLSKRGMAERN